MALTDWQRGFARLITAGASQGLGSEVRAQALADLCLTTGERDWLERCITTAGFEVTCSIQRRWRRLRLRIATKITMAALGRERSDGLIERFCSHQPLRSMFFVTEALEFLQFISDMVDGDQCVRTAADFERALLVAADARATVSWRATNDYADDCVLTRHSATAVVMFPCPPEAFVGAVILGCECPTTFERVPVVISPGLPYLWRPATEEEVSVLRHANNRTTGRELRLISEVAVCELLAMGALVIAPNSNVFGPDTFPLESGSSCVGQDVSCREKY